MAWGRLRPATDLPTVRLMPFDRQLHAPFALLVPVAACLVTLAWRFARTPEEGSSQVTHGLGLFGTAPVRTSIIVAQEFIVIASLMTLGPGTPIARSSDSAGSGRRAVGG